MKKNLLKKKIIEDEYNNYIDSNNLNFKKNSRILITGSSGFIGSYISKLLIFISKKNNLNLKLFLTFRNKKKFYKIFSYYKNDKNIKFVDLNISKEKSYFDNINVIFHCASYANPKIYNDKFLDVYDANINLTIWLCELIKKNKNSKFIYLSSSEVYGEFKSDKINEDSYGIVNPIKTESCYSLSKKIAENILINYFKKNKLKVKIIRLFHTIGFNEDDSDNRLFFDLMNSFYKKNKRIIIRTNPKTKRSYCHIADATNGILAVLQNGADGHIYNIGNPYNAISTEALISLISKVTKIKKKLYIKKNISIINLKSSYIPNIEKIKKIGWKPKLNLVDSIHKIKDFYI